MGPVTTFLDKSSDSHWIVPDRLKQSLLDLWLYTAGLAPYLKEMVIDNSRRWEVARPVQKDGKLQLTHTDHYTMIATFHNLPAARLAREEKQEVRWKTGTKESWKDYKVISKETGRKINEIVKREDKEIDEVLKKVEALENKLRFKSFGKYTVKSENKRREKIEEEQKDLTDEEKAKDLLEKQTKRIDESIKEIEKKGLSKVGRIHEVARQAKGKGKGAGQPTAIIDPNTGKLVVDKEEIKKTTVQYCKQVLTKNDPDNDFKTMAKIKEILHEQRMKARLDEGFFAEKEVFNKVLAKFKKNNKRNYDFLIKSSEEFKDAVFNLCKRIIDNETVPEKFRDTTLHQIWKRKKGSRKENLASNRYVHCKEYLAKTVEAMVMDEMEPNIVAATSKFQIGGVAGHRPQEHLFSLKSIQGKYEKDRKLLVIYTNDVSQFFDKEVLVDCMNEAYEAHVDPRAYRHFFLLNHRTRIRAKTSCGFSHWEEVGDLLGQGSKAAAKISALNLDRKLEKVFGDSKEMLRYGSVKQMPYSFQDDALVLVDDIEKLRVVAGKMETAMKMMQVDSNKDKCGYILLGPKNLVEEARRRLEAHPVQVGDWVVQELKQEKWLGDQLCSGLARSVMATIQDRAPKLRRASYEILNIVKDFRAQRIGGFCTALLLWETCAIPSLINNCSTWVGMGLREEEALAEVQNFFLRLLLGCGPGASKHALRADFGTWNMKLRVWREKLMLVHHIRNIEDGSLAKVMYQEQVRNSWTGLARETEELCEELNIENVNETELQKKPFKKVVNKACIAKEDHLMKEETFEMIKMRKIREEAWGIKDYVKSGNLYSVRSTWNVQSYMLDVAGNYSHHTKYEATGWLCQACDLHIREDQDHITQCKGYSDLLQGRNMDDDKELVEFYRLVMARREEQGWA